MGLGCVGLQVKVKVKVKAKDHFVFYSTKTIESSVR